ncbi:unnamed protein product [Mycena citricolor]|uniref:DNA repair protein RAD50 n=1 Tax=Mycena citricolor TaxID=2018698 RepID=A0AAD2H8E8_9AGAR|nr:unnamed protein product [Mycena citricolor]
MANEKEVKAQVRLRFIAANGQNGCSPKSQCDREEDGLTMKTLESVLALENNKETSGKRAVISTKCAELDAEIPQLLGVSKAVLENVIFCHQEDSYWPLAEPAALKKKFDDIFEATKYTKALDSIKSLRKSRCRAQAEKERLEGLSREKAHSDKLKTRVADLNKVIADKELEYEDTKKSVESLEESKSRAQADLQEARINLQDFLRSNEAAPQTRGRERKAENVENELSGARKQYTELAQQVGIFKSEFDWNESKRFTTSATIQDQSFSSSGLEAAKIVEFTNKIQDLSRKQRKTAEDLKRDRRAKEDEFKSKSAELTDSLNASKVSRNALQHQLPFDGKALIPATRRTDPQEDTFEREVDRVQLSAQVTQEGSKVYKELLRTGKQKKACSACNRHLDDHELMEFERVLQAKITKYSSSSKVVPQEEQDQWEALLKQVQALQPLETTRDRLKTVEIPELESKIQELNAEIPGASSSSDSFSEKLDDLKRDLREVQRLKMQGANISRLQKDLKRATENVATSEQQLSATGSTKTADEVQTELDELMAVIRKTEKQKEGLLKERETRMSATRVYENELHTMEIQSVDIRSKIREKESLEMSIQSMKEECQAHAVGVKEQDEKILELQAPIDALSNEHLRSQRELDADIVGAETAYSELAQRVDQLNGINKNIELSVFFALNWIVCSPHYFYLQICSQQTRSTTTRMHRKVGRGCNGNSRVGNKSGSRTRNRQRHREGDQRSGSAMATVRENLRVRRLIKEIKTIQENIDKEDIAAAAKAKRNFTEKFAIYKDKENRLQTEYAHMAGELSSSRNQLKQQELDLKEFKDVNKNYKDQLIKVKMSDMANNDLEKYAKALDNAIMKYHSLKMEEVNDIMKYLWNKTYQGSDIDTIRIRSDAEGGATKRSYNYRVVMTKDQVEMDMRGRCSAGQKMLASIIIRLALSDSFGQNCGILALDEPTNALDEKNIEALASSLISIIHERKSHSNFQLIVITHDEKFLAKLSQSGVLDYYWKMERDERQNSYITRKSVIEYH